MSCVTTPTCTTSLLLQKRDDDIVIWECLNGSSTFSLLGLPLLDLMCTSISNLTLWEFFYSTYWVCGNA